MPDGQVLNARLETDLSTRTATVGDRFTMTVTSPAQFEGATIEAIVPSYLWRFRKAGQFRGRVA